jgi:hypothetical protein
VVYLLVVLGLLVVTSVLARLAAGKPLPPSPDDLRRAGDREPTNQGEEASQSITRWWRPM